MKRDRLLNLLIAYDPSDAQEISFKKTIMNFVNNHEDCFERTLSLGHITASAWLLSKDHSKALLMHHTKLDQWFQLGGHCDGDTDVLKVALKEAQEESGIQGIEPVMDSIFDIDIHLIPENKKEAAHYHYDIRFLLRVVSDEEIVQNSEAKELRWVSQDKEALPTDRPSVIRMFEKWLLITKGNQ